MEAARADVKEYWEAAPCGTRDTRDVAEQEQHRELERIRDDREPFISEFARFTETVGQRVLEVGVGAGTDHLRFARAGARLPGIDLTEAAIALTRRRFAMEALSSDLRVGDAESLPFDDDRFDVVYSWGVIHHTPDAPRAAREIVRVLRPGGRFCVMVYNRRSLVALQTWTRFAALRGRFDLGIRDAIANHMESPGTQAYSAGEARALFPASDVRIDTRVTAYDLRLGRRRFLPRWTWSLIPASLGWFHIISGTK